MTTKTFPRFVVSSALATGLALAGLSAQASFLDHPDAAGVIDELAADGIDREQLRSWLAEGRYLESTRSNIASPTESRTTWADYRQLFVNDLSIERGRAFVAENAEALARAEQEFGVDRRVIAAIIGVETRYGRLTGGHRVLDAIGTTAFSDSPRSDYFLREMKAFLRLAHEEQFDPATLTGSYAGAMGVPQFMPSSFQAYAVDHDNDGRRDIWNSTPDAIGSVANYLAAHRWEPGAPVAVRARVTGNDFDRVVDNRERRPHTTVAETRQAGWEPAMVELDANQPVSTFRLEGPDGMEYWYGLHNFYAITRYNHSILYAMAVYQLSREL